MMYSDLWSEYYTVHRLTGINVRTNFDWKLEKAIHKIFTTDKYWVKDLVKDIKDIVIEARHDTPKPEFSSMHEMLAYVLGQEDWARKMNLNIKEKKRVIKK